MIATPTLEAVVARQDSHEKELSDFRLAFTQSMSEVRSTLGDIAKQMRERDIAALQQSQSAGIASRSGLIAIGGVMGTFMGVFVMGFIWIGNLEIGPIAKIVDRHDTEIASFEASFNELKGRIEERWALPVKP